MIVYTIKNSEKTKNYDECVFLETLDGIYVEAPCHGFFKHPSIKTPQELKNHLLRMKQEGFKVTKRTFTVNSF